MKEEDAMISIIKQGSISFAGMVSLFALASGCAMETGTGDSTDSTVTGTQEIRGGHRPDFRILGPEGRIRGKTYEQWSGEWWQWVYETPATNHPVLDLTGEFCHEGQQGPAFNLAGTFGGAASRTCTIRRSKPVLFPLITFQADNCGIPPENQLTEEQLRALLDGFDENVTSLSLEIDGVVIGDTKEELAQFLTDTHEFSYVVPEEDSLYELFGLDFAGNCAPSFTRGYFVMLEFDRGQHTIHFTAADASGFSIDSSYELTVR